MIVEFLRAWEDHTWDTEIVTVPDTDLESIKVTPAGDDAETLAKWAGEHLSGQTQYRKVILWSVYCVNPEGREDGSCPRCGSRAGTVDLTCPKCDNRLPPGTPDPRD